MGYLRLDVSMVTIEALNERGVGRLPGLLGIVFTRVDAAEIAAELAVRAELMAPNGFLHAGSIVTLADTTCGYGCFANLPQGATGYTTIELKSNHLGTAKEGAIASYAKAVHVGRTTQVWDAVVTHKESSKTIALFRCTQMILYPK
jgi:1,4-dihydroxy-2-naphthoyl-CoA hydrolase